MSLFVAFILAAVLLGAGAMLSPAWHSRQPRVALAAALCLALVAGGAVFYAEAFGWDTLVVDYLLFALLSGVVLGGTLSTAQARAEARGERLADRDQGWPGPGDLTFFAFVALLLLIPLLHLAAPLGDHSQIIGFHSLATRDGGSFNSLAPYHSDEPVIVSPAFHALSAYLSSQLEQSIPLIQMSATAVVALLIVWLAYDFGAELHNKRLGRAMAAATLLCLSLYRSFLDGHFAELLALLFVAAFLLYALRLLLVFNLADLAAGGLMLGAVAYSNLSLLLVAVLGWLALLVLCWTRERHKVAAKSRWALTLVLPAIALLGIAPWLVNSLPLIFPPAPSPFAPEPGNLLLMINENGVAICLLAIWGIWQSLRACGELRLISRLMLIWLIIVIEFSTVGFIGALLPPLGDLTNAPNIARHGPILPFAYFGGLALLRLWSLRLPARLKERLRRSAYPIVAVAAALLTLVAVAFAPLLNLLGFPPASLNQDDLAAMIWLRDNTPKDAVVMAADSDAWLPLFAERRSVDFRAVRYFEWDFITDAAVDLAEVDYIFAPAGVDPPADSPSTLVLVQGEAQVYKILPNHRGESD